MDYIYKKSGAIFNAHSYWTKQPVDVIKKFIEKYTSIGDTILDPFCGSGMTGVAAIGTNRRFRLSDLSPICVHIAKGYCNKVSIDEIDIYLRDIKESISGYYHTKCNHCNTTFEFDYAILEDKLEKDQKLELINVVGKCPNCKQKIRKRPDNYDLKLNDSKDYLNYFYPKDKFFGNEPKRNYKKGIFEVYQLYSTRNLNALSRLFDKINRISDKNIRQFFLFAFSSILFNCSIMSRYNPKYENTQIKMGSYYVPSMIKENNVYMSFERKVKAIIKSRNEVFKNNELYDGDICIADATDLHHLDDESIDYIYTDPPYSDKISYSELNLVYESWLQNGFTDTKMEMIVSKSSGKDIDFYSTLFTSFMKEAHRVLKNNKYMTVIFHNSNVEHWRYFQKIVNIDGLEPIVQNEPDRLISASKTSTQYQAENDSQCFLAFTFKKNRDYLYKDLVDLSDEEYYLLIENIREEAISKGYNKKSDQFDFIINRLVFSTMIKPYFKI